MLLVISPYERTFTHHCEKGQAPEFMIATGQACPGKSQPLCAYPKIATYTGGDGNKAESFECR